MNQGKTSTLHTARIAIALLAILAVASVLVFDPGSNLVAKVNSMDGPLVPTQQPSASRRVMPTIDFKQGSSTTNWDGRK